MKERPIIFISYCKSDEVLKDRLVGQLGVLKHRELCVLWDRSQIEPGLNEAQEIAKAISSAKVAFLILSGPYLNDISVVKHEFEPILDRHEKEGLRVIPILAKPYDWRGEKRLSPILRSDDMIVSGRSDYEIDNFFAEIATVLRRELENRSTSVMKTINPEPSAQTARSVLKNPSASWDTALSRTSSHSSAKTDFDGPSSSTQSEHEYDVFLCHSSVDKESVKRIAMSLVERGIRPWLDEWALKPGQVWQKHIEVQIQRIPSAVVFIGAEGLGPWQRMEVDALLREFHQRGCPIIPVLLPEAKTKLSLPPFLAGIHWVDFRKQDPSPIDQLVWGITGSSSRRASSMARKSRTRGLFPIPRLLHIVLLLILVVTVATIAGTVVVRKRREANRTHQLLDVVMRESVGLTFYDACYTVGPPARDLNGVSASLLNERSQGPFDCDESESEKIIESNYPLMVLAEPGGGKRFSLLRIRKALAERGIPSILLTVRDCLLAHSSNVLRNCLKAELRKLTFEEDYTLDDELYAQFVRKNDWWLLIDGVDEVGDPTVVANYLLELAELYEAHGSRIVASAKGENMAYTLHMFPSDDRIRRIFTAFWRAHLHGLRADGAAKMAEDVIHDPSGVLRLEGIRKATMCNDDTSLLAGELLRRPSFIRRAFSKERPFIPATIPCSEEMKVQLASWLETAQFDDYCSSLCGPSGERSRLQASVGIVLENLARHTSDRIDRTTLVGIIHSPGTTDAADDDRVIRAVVGTGALSVIHSGSFRIVRPRLAHHRTIH